MAASAQLETVLDYHAITTHRFEAYAEGPGYLDWATQPNPFRRYAGARLIELAHVAQSPDPVYDAIFSAQSFPAAAAFDHRSVSQLFLDSMALSAWKSTGTSRWALRMNASSGNLHPTEAWLVCGPVDGLCERPMVAHYAPKQHALEVRAEFPVELWQRLAAGFPFGTCFVGLSSIHWREAWKYGRRAFRYCMLDVGHALAALGFAAAGLGWRLRLLDDIGSAELACLLGTGREHEAEPEEPDLLVACMPRLPDTLPVPASAVLREFEGLDWYGTPNTLSPAHIDWGMEAIAAAVRRPHGGTVSQGRADDSAAWQPSLRDSALRPLIHRRRSAVAMDGQTRISAATFYRMLGHLLAVDGRVPFDALPWEPCIHLALLVHRVDGLAPGLYLLLRHAGSRALLERSITRAGEWRKPPDCPPGLPLFRLFEADLRHAARAISCHQDIASDGCFSLAMLAEFGAPLTSVGPWQYPRLYWEAGMLGQLLYLEAEAAGIQGTGIGCYFDDAMHDLLGLEGIAIQDLYHFTVGGAVEDSRLSTLPPYG